MKVYASIAFAVWASLSLFGCASGADPGSSTGPFGSGNTVSATGASGTGADDAEGSGTIGGEEGEAGPGSATDGSSVTITDSSDSNSTGPGDTGPGGPCNTGDTEPCYTGPAGTEGQGPCVEGVRSCEGGQWGACVGEVVPATEVCDGEDNDCNGTADDGEASGGTACDTGMPGVCADGVEMCTGGVLDCVPNVAASAETCDNLDNDCDGQIDNGNPGGGAACNTGMLGVCAAGTQTCSGGGLTCVQNVQAAPNDTCFDSLDNDCDGTVDENCNTCAHDLCVTGVALTPGCDPCVDTVCAIDAFCCNNSWDSLCVDEAAQYCGLPC